MRRFNRFYVRELVECLVQIAGMKRPERVFELGAIDPMDLREALCATARRMGRAQPRFVPVPQAPLRLATLAFDRLFGPMPSLTERLDGLIALSPMATERSLKLLSRTLAPFG